MFMWSLGPLFSASEATSLNQNPVVCPVPVAYVPHKFRSKRLQKRWFCLAMGALQEVFCVVNPPDQGGAATPFPGNCFSSLKPSKPTISLIPPCSCSLLLARPLPHSLSQCVCWYLHLPLYVRACVLRRPPAQELLSRLPSGRSFQRSLQTPGAQSRSLLRRVQIKFRCDSHGANKKKQYGPIQRQRSAYTPRWSIDCH